jgi:hypothetical protein
MPCPERAYTVAGLEGERLGQHRGRDLMENGLRFTDLPEPGSALLRIS